MYSARRLTLSQTPQPVIVSQEDTVPGASFLVQCLTSDIVLLGPEDDIEDGFDWPAGAVYSAKTFGSGPRADVLHVAVRVGTHELQVLAGGI